MRPLPPVLRRLAPWTGALLAIYLTFNFGATGAGSSPAEKLTPAAGTPETPYSQSELVSAGRRLFLMNCAHCHASDATGDEGPDLHGVRKSEARLAALIENGVKGEMPKFGAKLSHTEVQALVAFIRSL
ncbi:MAG TPA: cytochrome c [Verrucomicrobiae bacterium]|jgi:mono/diheme cytochrome c family protein|nr:cytochrome c [Verrucomicrobiae bacterium]